MAMKKWHSRYLGYNHSQLRVKFMTNFIPWPGHDIGQVHYLENYMTSSRVMAFDKVMTLVNYKAFALSFVQDHGLSHDHGLGHGIVIAMTLP